MDVVVVNACRGRGLGLLCCWPLLQRHGGEWLARYTAHICHHCLNVLQLRWGLHRVSAVCAGVLLLLLAVEGLLSVLAGVLHAARRLWRRAASC